jgi:imidazolonepropionase
LREGATAIEIKSGYGLDRDTELRMLRVARRLGEDISVRTTFLGAHALPPEYAGRADDYIDFVCEEVLPAVAREGLADAVDAFCERIAFNASQTRKVFQKAQALGLPVKLHADQLSDSGGAALAAEFRALSADHVEYTSEAGVEAMKREGTVAVLLPGAFYFLRETKPPPVDLLKRKGVPIALATDHNPGTSPVSSPLAILNLACTLFRLTPEEALAGMTRHAARALGLQASHGTLEPGKNADLALWDVGSPGELAYALGANPCVGCVRGGRILRPAHAAADGAASPTTR